MLFNHSVVLTVYNAPGDVMLCLQSLASSLDFSRAELVIVDDASQEETQRILDDFAAAYPCVTLIRHEKNQGYLHSVNDGISHTAGDIITLLNSDTYIPKDFTARILTCFEYDEKIGVASPVLSHGNPFSVPLTFQKQELNARTLPVLVGAVNKKAHEIIPCYPDIVFPDGACFSIRRSCLEAIGLFDEAYSPGYFEELDFCMRAHKRGFRCVFMENLYVYHKSHASFGKKKTSEYMARNQKRFYDNWGEEYTRLKYTFPKKMHKKRVFCFYYSLWYYVFVESLLTISRIIPLSSLRRKIRALYQ
jgi:GT2 family glycosyltransferase